MLAAYSHVPLQVQVRSSATERVLSMTDRSNGYEGVAAEFLAGRGRAPSTGIGARAVCDWARTLPRGAAIIDLGCGSGLPITKVLVSFLLLPEEQRRLIQRIADILVPGGRLLFTSCPEPLVWNDAMTGLESRSLGAAEYRRQLSAVGLSVISEYEDEGQNHYFDAFKTGPGESRPMTRA